MRRGEEAGFIAGVAIDRFEHRAGRAFAVGAGDVDEFEFVLRATGKLGEFERALQSKIRSKLLKLVEELDGFFVIHGVTGCVGRPIQAAPAVALSCSRGTRAPPGFGVRVA